MYMDSLDDPQYRTYKWEKLGDHMDVFEIYYGFFNDGVTVKDCVAMTLSREIVGMFTINSNITHFKTLSAKDKPNNVMHIVVDSNYNGLGITKILISNLVNKLRKKYSKYSTDNTILSIVGDASDGFWEHIGMKGDEQYKETTINNLEGYLGIKKLESRAGKRKKKPTKKKKPPKKKKPTKRRSHQKRRRNKT